MALRGQIARQGAIAAVLCALVGCQVPTEGAPCQADASCPRGQRCGVDGRCSVKAAKCTECADGETKCDGEELLRCVAPDGICRVFGDPAPRGDHQKCDDSTPDGPKLLCNPTDCTAEGLACAGGATWITCAVDTDGCLFYSESEPSVACAPGLLCGSTASSCRCPAASGNTFYVDPVAGSEVGADPDPTGAEAPAGCRFKALGPAVDAANEHARSSAGAATVMVSATGGTRPLAFTETAIELEPGVTLTSDAQTSPAGPPASFPYVLEVSDTPGVTLHEGATFSGLQLRPAAGASVTDAIVTSCASGATQAAVVQDAMVLGADGGARFVNGVHQTGACSITVTRTLLEGNEEGIRAQGGALTVDACTVSGGQTGILLEPPTGSTATVTVKDTLVERAAETGIRLLNMSGSRVTLTGNSITENCATTDYPSTAGPQRAGGILFYGTLPDTTFTGNKVLGNGWNQVLVYQSDGSLVLSGGAVPADCVERAIAVNQFCANPSAGQSGVGVFSIGASVAALFNRWAHVPPGAADYGGTGVDPAGSDNSYCPQIVTCAAACPQP